MCTGKRAFVAALVSFSVFGAPKHWLWERGAPQGNSLVDVAAVSPTSAFGVGDFGAIVHYVGTSGWSVQTSGTNHNLTGVAIADGAGTTAFVVGNGATLLKTSDSGASWTNLACPGCGELKAVVFRSTTVGVIAGSGGLRYTVDGTTFSLAAGSVGTIVKLAMAPGATSAVVYGMRADGTVYKSSNNGASWTAATQPVAGATWYGLSVVSDTQLFVSGAGNRVYSNSTSGTGTWTQLTASTNPSFDFVDIAMTSATSGFAIAIPTPVPPADLQFKLFSCSASACTEMNIGTQSTDVWPAALWASGSDLFIAGQGGMLFRSTNGGQRLFNDGNATGQRYFDVAWVDANHQIAAGAEGAVSVGSFSIWSEYRCGTTDFSAVAVGSATSVAVGLLGSVCYATNTNLASWTKAVNTPSATHQRAVAWVGGTTFVSGGDDGVTWYSTTGGSSWTALDLDTSANSGIVAISTQPSTPPEVWVSTGGLKLYRTTTPTMASYSEVSSALVPRPTTLTPPGATVRDISWVDSSNGFLVVSSAADCAVGVGYVYRTTNGGGSWSLIIALPMCSSCFGWDDLYAQSATSVWVQGETCFAHLSSDANGTWTYTSEQVPTPLALLGLGGHQSGELWMVGNFGAVLHSHCGGTDTSSCSPDSNSCTDDSCRPADGACVHTVSTSNSCSDGLDCTTSDVCLPDGGCEGTVSCPGATQCTSSACEPSTGQCRTTSFDTTVGCDDGDPCTEGDHCVAGTCLGMPSCVSDAGPGNNTGTTPTTPGTPGSASPLFRPGCGCEAGAESILGLVLLLSFAVRRSAFPRRSRRPSGPWSRRG